MTGKTYLDGVCEGIFYGSLIALAVVLYKTRPRKEEK